jgi:hypothetical protein
MTVTLVGFFGILVIRGCGDAGFGFVKAGKAGGRGCDATVGVGYDALAVPVAGDGMTVAHV